jgi:hypothetical protein
MHMQHPGRFFLYQILNLSYHDAVITCVYTLVVQSCDCGVRPAAVQLDSMHPRKRSYARAE